MAAWLVPICGWEALFVVGGIVPLVVALLLALLLPESLLFLTNRGKDRAQLERRVHAAGPDAGDHGRTPCFALRGRAGSAALSADLFAPGLRVTTPMLWLMFAACCCRCIS